MLSLMLQKTDNLLVARTVINLTFSLKDLFNFVIKDFVICSPFLPKF